MTDRTIDAKHFTEEQKLALLAGRGVVLTAEQCALFHLDPKDFAGPPISISLAYPHSTFIIEKKE
jgi:hypothetical protein